MLQAKVTSQSGQLLTEYEVRNTLVNALEHQLTNQRVLVLIPDHTRSLPLPFLFRAMVDVLHDAKQLDFMVALGTHPPLSEESIYKLVGITVDERNTEYATIGLPRRKGIKLGSWTISRGLGVYTLSLRLFISAGGWVFPGFCNARFFNIFPVCTSRQDVFYVHEIAL